MSLANLDLLRPIHLFAMLGDDELRTLAHELDEVHYLAGQSIFSAGGPGDRMYIIERGQVELSLPNQPNGQTGGSVQTGEIFGEQAFLSGEAHAFSARALTDTQVIAIDQPDLERLVQTHPTAALAMLTALSRYQRAANAVTPTLPSANYEIAAAATFLEKLSDFATELMGDIRFVGCYSLWIAVWIILNARIIPGMTPFDPFPFPVLTLLLLLEIALLGLFMLVAQSRQADREKIYNDIEYEVNRRTEADIRALTQQLEEFQRATMTHFALLERRR